MSKYKLEYIWLDGKKPVPGLRGKSLIKSFEKPPTLADLPLWGFDGSSTMQAEGSKSDCVLKPVALYPDGAKKDGYLVLSEVMHPDGTPHSTNMRATAPDDPDIWFGFEQEYFLYKDGRPLGFPKDGHPSIPQFPYYCGVGYKYMGSIARTSSRNILTSVSTRASTTKASTLKWPRASGSSRSSARARTRQRTTCGWPAI